MQLNLQPLANAAAIISGDRYRFTLLADGLLRYEWAEDGVFEDRASTFAIRRNLPVPKFHVVDKSSLLEIVTERLHLIYDKKPFSPNGLSIKARSNFSLYHSLWRYGEKAHGLGGTARTLDDVDGSCDVGPGVVARTGITVIDDSSSMLLQVDGWVNTRRPGHRVDGYVFVYGHHYRTAVRALYTLSGDQPLLPRWTLGNWWSRFHRYSAEEYLELMDRFRQEGIPLSVAVLDMNWHLVDTYGVDGSGWTGYSWNKKLFTDPSAFLDELHRRGLKTTLNVHPAEGVRSFEDAYEDVAKALQRDASKGHPIEFDITDPDFLDVYFSVLHGKLEKQGVDFWWLDWQQGECSRIAGIDPLWMLNHFHFLDNASGGRRPVILSRYAGPGSHRYPLGFSGDTVVSWASLDF
jgi:alpha-glucosidase (family GH31 glycosyl hydrolase)